MRHLTHRANFHPAQIGGQETRRSQDAARRTIEGQKVHLSGRSMWRGYWYGKGSIAKWNRVEQVLTGMKWSYYTGKQVKTAQISLLENHHAATGAGQGLNEAAAEKKDGEGKSSSHGTNHYPKSTYSVPARATADLSAQDARMHAHWTEETGRIDARMCMSAPGAARIHAHEGLGAAGPEGEKRTASPHDIALASPGNHQAASSEAPCPSIGVGAFEVPAPIPAGSHVSLNAETAAAGELYMGQPRPGMVAGAHGAAHAASGAISPGAIGIPAPIIAFSDALSSAVFGIIRHAGIGHDKSGKNHADAMRGGAGSAAFPAPPPASANPANMICAPSSAQDAPAFGYGQGYGAPENTNTGAGHAHRPAVHVGSPKRKSIQLKVARADALPPQ